MELRITSLSGILINFFAVELHFVGLNENLLIHMLLLYVLVCYFMLNFESYTYHLMLVIVKI